MRKTNFIILVILITINLVAQNNKDSVLNRLTNNIYLNLLGEVSLYSFNYEHFFNLGSGYFVAAKVGVGYSKEFVLFNFSGSPVNQFIAIPHHITLNYGKRKSFVELGVGGTLLPYGQGMYFLYPILGLRYQPLKSGKFIFRIDTSYPIIKDSSYDFFISPIGISFGLAI